MMASAPPSLMTTSQTLPSPPHMFIQLADTANTGSTATFTIPGRSTIPSDGQNEKQTHKVSIAIIDLDAWIEWIAVPKRKPSAFMRCRVKNTSQYTLLPGPASVFMDGSFVCQSSIPNVSPNESFSTSLGVDPALRVTYHNQLKNTKSNSGTLLSSKSDITSYTQRITIKNTRSTAISPLFIKDQVPVSENTEIKVTVLEPKDIGLPNDRREVGVASGVKARWAVYNRSYGESDGASPSQGVEEEGVVEWVCDIESGKVVDVSLQWDVSVPAGQRWVAR